MKINWNLLTFALIGLGLSTSVYLLIRHFAVSRGETELFDLCKVVFRGDCDAAIRSSLSVQLGIPLAGWGLVHFVMVTFTLLLATVLGDSFRTEATLVVLLLCTVATVAGGVLTAMMLTGVAAFCELCVCIHLINFLLIPLIKLGSAATFAELLGSVKGGLRYLIGRGQDPVLARWKITGLVSILLAGIVSYQGVLIQTERRLVKPDSAVTLADVLEEFDRQTPVEIPIGPEDPRLGDKDSPMRMVLFSDFRCPACRQFAFALLKIRSHPKLLVVFKHYPLSNQCNESVSVDMHPLSCAAAASAEAARQQGKFWQFHDAMFAGANPALKRAGLRDIARRIGLDMALFDAAMAHPSTSDRVKANVSLGNSLNISETPTVFLNGKKLTRKALLMLEELIAHQLNQ